MTPWARGFEAPHGAEPFGADWTARERCPRADRKRQRSESTGPGLSQPTAQRVLAHVALDATLEAPSRASRTPDRPIEAGERQHRRHPAAAKRARTLRAACRRNPLLSSTMPRSPDRGAGENVSAGGAMAPTTGRVVVGLNASSQRGLRTPKGSGGQSAKRDREARELDNGSATSIAPWLGQTEPRRRSSRPNGFRTRFCEAVKKQAGSVNPSMVAR
jgi:hypothetical protein